MKLGAQLFSVRNLLTTPADIRKTFAKIKAIGYDNVQLSGAGPIDAEELKEIVAENELPIVCTHCSFDRLVNDTEKLIWEHQTYGCPVIGIGAMPNEFRGSLELAQSFIDTMRTPVEKIKAAGLRFAYHNHDFELRKIEGESTLVMDLMLEQCPDWSFIMDTYWVEFAGHSALDYMKKIGSDRLQNIHFKDMDAETRKICACGSGTLNFAEIADLCRKMGVQNVLVEQDNAADEPDPLVPMTASYNHLRKLI